MGCEICAGLCRKEAFGRGDAGLLALDVKDTVWLQIEVAHPVCFIGLFECLPLFNVKAHR